LDEALLIMATLPFALTGGVWFLYLLGYNLSIATGVGFIALAGVAAEFGVVMLIYLKQALAERCPRRQAPTMTELLDAIREGAVLRVRPKAMTVAVILAGLVPIVWGSGRGRLRKRKIKHAKPLLTQMFDCSWHFHHGNCNCPTLAKCRTPLQIESQNTSRANQPSAVLTATARTHAFPPVEYGPPAAC
jgi:hypothetical protein